MSSRTSAPTPAPDGLARLRSFPRAPAPNDNPAAVKSNLPEADVVLNQNILAHHVAHHPDSAVFGNIQSGRLKLVELYVRDRHSGAAPPQDAAAAKSASLEGMTVCELTVEKGAQSRTLPPFPPGVAAVVGERRFAGPKPMLTRS